MRTETKTLGNQTALIFGEPCDRVFLVVHGQGGCKEDAADFARWVTPFGWQVCAIDLPGHGERRNQDGLFPWIVVPELKQVLNDLEARWNRVGLYAQSLGAWFSLLAFAGYPFEQVLLVSPLLDMESLIRGWMDEAGISVEELRERGEIPLADGRVLNQVYLDYAKTHPVMPWNTPTSVLQARRDPITPLETTEVYAKPFHWDLRVIPDGTHGFHGPLMKEVLEAWILERIRL